MELNNDGAAYLNPALHTDAKASGLSAPSSLCAGELDVGLKMKSF